MSLYRNMKETIAKLEEAVNQGSFIEDLLKAANVEEKVVESIVANYQLMLQRISSASSSMQSELEKIKVETRHRIQSSLQNGEDPKEVINGIEDDFQCFVRASIALSYPREEALAILKDKGLYEEACDRGAIVYSTEIKPTVLTGEMKKALANVAKKRVSRLVIK